jgi:ABC-type amino acid transport substrate-binding protein
MSKLKTSRRAICLGVLVLVAAAGCADKSMQIKTFPTSKQAIGQVLAGNADAAVGDYPVIVYEARESVGRLDVAGNPFDIETAGIGVSKNAPQLKAIITDALNRIVTRGEYNKILVKWAVPAGAFTPLPAPSGVPTVGEVEQLVDGELKVGMELSYPPMEFFDEFKRESGVDVEIAKALGNALGVKVVFVDLPFEALIGAVDTQKVDVIISAMAISDERSAQIDFIPYLALGSGIMVKKGNPLQIRKTKDLCGKVVAVAEATSQLNALKNQVCE